MTERIPQQQVNDALFSFLQSIYLFEQREVERFNVDWNEVYLLQLLIRYPGMRISEISNRMSVKEFVKSRMVTKLQSTPLHPRANPYVATHHWAARHTSESQAGRSEAG